MIFTIPIFIVLNFFVVRFFIIEHEIVFDVTEYTSANEFAEEEAAEAVETEEDYIEEGEVVEKETTEEDSSIEQRDHDREKTPEINTTTKRDKSSNKLSSVVCKVHNNNDDDKKLSKKKSDRSSRKRVRFEASRDDNSEEFSCKKKRRRSNSKENMKCFPAVAASSKRQDDRRRGVNDRYTYGGGSSYNQRKTYSTNVDYENGNYSASDRQPARFYYERRQQQQSYNDEYSSSRRNLSNSSRRHKNWTNRMQNGNYSHLRPHGASNYEDIKMKSEFDEDLHRAFNSLLNHRCSAEVLRKHETQYPVCADSFYDNIVNLLELFNGASLVEKLIRKENEAEARTFLTHMFNISVLGTMVSKYVYIDNCGFEKSAPHKYSMLNLNSDEVKRLSHTMFSVSANSKYINLPKAYKVNKYGTAVSGNEHFLAAERKAASSSTATSAAANEEQTKQQSTLSDIMSALHSSEGKEIISEIVKSQQQEISSSLPQPAETYQTQQQQYGVPYSTEQQYVPYSIDQYNAQYSFDSTYYQNQNQQQQSGTPVRDENISYYMPPQ